VDAAARCNNRRNQLHELAARQVIHQQAIDPAHGRGQVRAERQAGASVGTTYRGDERRPDAMPGHVGQCDHRPAVRQRDPVEVVAASFVRGVVPTGDLVALDIRHILRQQPLLNGARYLEITPHTLHLARLPKRHAQMATDLPSDLAGDPAREQKHDRVRSEDRRVGCRACRMVRIPLVGGHDDGSVASRRDDSCDRGVTRVQA